MVGIPLAAMSFVMKFAGALWVLVSVVLILMVLIQKGRGGGLSAAFGGGGAGGGLLGSKTGDFLTWVTIGLVAVWLLLSIVAAKWFIPRGSDLLKPGQPQPIATAPEVEQELPSIVELNEPNTAVLE